MPVAIADMKWLLSGDSGNTDEDMSLGGGRSSTEVVFSPILNNLFDNVTPEQSATGEVEYRCIFLQNDHATDTITDVKIWVYSNTPNANTTIAIGLDPAGKNTAADTISPSTEAPAGVTFSTPTDYAGGLSIGTMNAQDVYPVWIRRTTTAGAVASANDNFYLGVQGVPL